jgi:hypothetical protein
METVGKWGLGTEGFDVLEVLFIICGERNSKCNIFALYVREEFDFFENSGLHDIFEIRLSESSIPVINNMATVHYLTENVNEVFEWNL